MLSTEWQSFLEKAAKLASSIPGKEAILKLIDQSTWATTPEEANRLQKKQRSSSRSYKKQSFGLPLMSLKTLNLV